jgi:hypothetical protein
MTLRELLRAWFQTRCAIPSIYCRKKMTEKEVMVGKKYFQGISREVHTVE